MDKECNIYNKNKLEFAIFCIENIADFLGKDAPQVYKMLTEESDIEKNYIVAEYEMLHTQSKEYIVNDIIELMRERGVAI
ncbi:MAG: DUF3791 domain-containing protein [Acetivibrio ethanolgignens]